MSEYGLDVGIAVSGDGEAKERLKALERFMESARSRATALNRLRISPAIAIDDRISSPLRSVRSDLERAGGMYLKVFSNAGAGMTDWFNSSRAKAAWWKNELIRDGREAAENVLSEFQRVYAKIRKMFLDKLNLELDVAGKLLVEHRVVAFINTMGRNNTAPEGEYPGTAANKNNKNSSFETMKNGIDSFNKIWSGFSGGIKASDKMVNSNIPSVINGYASKVGEGITEVANTVGGTKLGDKTLGEIGSGVVGFGKKAYDGAAEYAGGLFKGISNVANTVSEVKVGNKTLGDIGSRVFSGAAEGAGDLFKGYSNFARNVPYLGEAIDAFNIATSNDKIRATAQAVGGMGGTTAGAMFGAAIGSVVPVVGTAFGGILGGIAGSFAGDWLAGKMVDQVRSRSPEKTANPYGAGSMLMSPATPDSPVGNENNTGKQGGITQNLTLNVTVDSDMSRTELAQFVAERIAAAVSKVMQNSTPQASPAQGG